MLDKVLQVYNEVQGLATSVHLRMVKSTKQHPSQEKNYRSKGTMLPLYVATDQSDDHSQIVEIDLILEVSRQSL